MKMEAKLGQHGGYRTKVTFKDRDSVEVMRAYWLPNGELEFGSITCVCVSSYSPLFQKYCEMAKTSVADAANYLLENQ